MKTTTLVAALGVAFVSGATILAARSVGPGPAPGFSRASAPLFGVPPLIQIQQADSSHDGYITAADYLLFSSNGGGGGGGGATPTPTPPSGIEPGHLVMQADARDSSLLFSDNTCSTPITAGGSVACWQDEIGGFQFTTSGANPRWIASNLESNSGNALDFDAEALAKASAAGLPTTKWTWCATVEATKEVGTSVFFSEFEGSGHGFGLGATLNVAHHPTRAYYGNANTTQASGAINLFEAHTLCTTYDSTAGAHGTSKGFVDGSLVYTYALAAAIDYTGVIPAIGDTNGTGENWHGRIYDVLAWDLALSSADLLNVSQYERGARRLAPYFSGSSVSGSGGGGGGVTSVSGSAPIVSSGGSAPTISIPKATGAVDGYLSAADWTSFNGKASAHTCDASGAVASGSVAAGGSTTRTVSCGGATTASACYWSVPHGFLADGALIEKSGPVAGGVTNNYFCSKAIGTCTINATTAHVICDN